MACDGLKVGRLRPEDLPVFSVGHDTELAWFFQQSSSALGERSTLGGQLSAIERFSAGSDGHKVPSRNSVESDVWRVRSARVFAGDVALGEFDPSLDAQPTLPRDRQNDGYVPNDGDLRRFAEVSRALRLLSPAMVDALARWYTQGERWQSGPHGRLLPVMVATASGAKVLAARKRRREDAGIQFDELQPDEQMAAEARDNAARNDTQRRSWLEGADTQASRIMAEARTFYADARARTHRIRRVA